MKVSAPANPVRIYDLSGAPALVLLPLHDRTTGATAWYEVDRVAVLANKRGPKELYARGPSV